MRVERNRHPAGRLQNMLFGLAQTFDGLVRVLSGGFCHSTAALDLSRRQARLAIQRMKKQ